MKMKQLDYIITLHCKRPANLPLRVRKKQWNNILPIIIHLNIIHLAY